MSVTPGPSRRAFLTSMLGGAAVVTLPAVGTADNPRTSFSSLAFDGNRLITAGHGLATSDDGGRSWLQARAPGSVAALATHRDRPGLVVAGLEQGGAVLSENGGATWRTVSGGLPPGAVIALAIASRDPAVFYAAIRGDGLWRSEDAGDSWSFVMDRPWLDEAEHDPLTLASVDLETGMGGIWLYAGTASGLTRVPDCFCRWQDVQPGDAMDALAAGQPPPAQAPLPAGEPVLSLASAPSEPMTLYAALPSGIWISRDAGVVWKRATAGTATVVAVHPADPHRLAAVIGGTLTLSRDGGATWAAVAAA